MWSKRPASRLDTDPFDLYHRFVVTHKEHFATVLREVSNGRKVSHWSWYIFPTAPYVVNGVERGSWTNRKYALRDPPPNQHRGVDAAKAYLTFPEHDGVSLRRNYIEMMQACIGQFKQGMTAREVVGSVDEPKLRSSLCLFETASRDGFDNDVHKICVKALQCMDSGCKEDRQSQL